VQPALAPGLDALIGLPDVRVVEAEREEGEVDAGEDEVASSLGRFGVQGERLAGDAALGRVVVRPRDTGRAVDGISR